MDLDDLEVDDVTQESHRVHMELTLLSFNKQLVFRQSLENLVDIELVFREVTGEDQIIV